MYCKKGSVREKRVEVRGEPATARSGKRMENWVLGWGQGYRKQDVRKRGCHRRVGWGSEGAQNKGVNKKKIKKKKKKKSTT